MNKNKILLYTSVITLLNWNSIENKMVWLKNFESSIRIKVNACLAEENISKKKESKLDENSQKEAIIFNLVNFNPEMTIQLLKRSDITKKVFIEVYTNECKKLNKEPLPEKDIDYAIDWIKWRFWHQEKVKTRNTIKSLIESIKNNYIEVWKIDQ